MRVEITADHKVPADEFEDLIKAYPTGRYRQGGSSNWFIVRITTTKGEIELTWFKEW